MTTSKLAYEAAFPDGFVTSVNYVVPKKLSDIAEKLEALDVEDEDAVAEVRAEIIGNRSWRLHVSVYRGGRL